jgi:hypothetical protein
MVAVLKNLHMGLAKFWEDMEELREANTALVVRTLESYARHNTELDEHGPTTT